MLKIRYAGPWSAVLGIVTLGLLIAVAFEEKSDRQGRRAGVQQGVPASFATTLAAGSHVTGGRLPPQHKAIEVTSLELAQNHVLPPSGRTWTLGGNTYTLTLAGKRDTLAMVTFPVPNPGNPRIEGIVGGVVIGSLPLLPPSSLPPTEAGGVAYSAVAYSAMLPPSWMVPGLHLRARADTYAPGAWHAVRISADSKMGMRILPFYLFGATPANSFPLATTGIPPADVATELFAKWPMSELQIQNHPMKAVVWPEIVSGPNGTSPGYVIHNMNEQQNGFAVMGAVHSLSGMIRAASGESSGAWQYYAPLIMFTANGAYGHPGGGLGGGGVGVGDHSYTYIFEHEQGHAFGLPHVGDWYNSGGYPYPGGSLLGSNWGFDSLRREFQPSFMPPTSAWYPVCRQNNNRQIDEQGRCVKQDPMQAGQGDGASTYRFSIFSDFSAAVIQRWLEGTTTVAADGTHQYSGGGIHYDPAFPGQYKRWDAVDARWVNFSPDTTTLGLYGLRQGLPLVRNVPVHTVALAFSYADPSLTRIYPPISYSGGNLLEYIDPTDPLQRAAISPSGGQHQWFCQDSGCDYTLRATYTNGTTRHILLQSGFRPWFGASQPVLASASDPLAGHGFRRWVVNFPGSVALHKVELLETPMAWQGFPANPVVKATYTVPAAQASSIQPAARQRPAGGLRSAECTDLQTIVVSSTRKAPPRCGAGGDAR